MAEEVFVSRFWRGRGRLWVVYWLYGVLGSAILTALLAAPVAFAGMSAIYYLIMLAVVAVYTVWIVVSVWRCAFNVDREMWAYLARGLTVFWALNVVLLSIFLGLDLVAAAVR